MGRFFVNRPIVSMVISIITVIVGLLALTALPVEQYPSITPPQVAVRTSYTGANAINIEESVATPLEQKINGVENMLYMKSTNASAGTMSIRVSFEVGTDEDMNTVFVQNRVAAASSRLPEEVKRIGVTTEKSLSSILLAILLTDENNRYDGEFLGNYGVLNIQDVLARVNGVGRVTILGAGKYAMRIWIRPDRLARMSVSVPEIISAVRSQSAIVPGGRLGGEPAPSTTEFTYTMNMPERLQTAEDFGEIIVRTQPDGSQIKVKDVARVELGAERYEGFGRLDGKDAAVIAVYQAPGSNAVELAAEIKNVMDHLAESFPEGLRYDVALDTTLAVTEGIREITITLFVALALVVLVVFLFIQDWRATLIPIIAIPVSLIGAFAVFPLIGFTLNVLSLLGLVLAIGIVVDDAIVVVEAVQVHMEKGLNASDAAINAMEEVTAPIVATTLVLVAVFIPVAVMGGITGKLYQQFAITIVVSVIFSSINALSLSPALCALLLKAPRTPGGPLGWFFQRFNNVFDRSTRSYMKLTNIMTRKLSRSIIITGIILVGLVVLGKILPGAFLPEEDMGYCFVNVELPDAASLSRTDQVCLDVEEIVRSHEEVAHVTSVVGFGMLSGTMLTNCATLFVSLDEWKKREITANDLISRLNMEFAAKINAARVFTFGPPSIPGLGKGSGFTLMLEDKGGNTPDYLSRHADLYAEAALRRPEIGTIFTPFRANVPQRKIEINREKALKAGVPLNNIYTTVSCFLGGSYINDFNRFGRLYRTYIQAEPEYRQIPEQINAFHVNNAEGSSVPLSAFVTVSETNGPSFTNRFNLYRAAEFTGSAAKGYSSAQAVNALEEVAAEVLPSDMGYEWSGMSYQEKKASGSGSMVFVFSLIFVFLILAAQYNSWSLPFSILFGTPFAIFGALLALNVSRFFSLSYENNIFAQISLVMLIAMAAKNAILIVEFAKLNFDQGKSIVAAAREAAQLRFRPILMTSFSFILGVLPLVFAAGAGAEARKVMGMSLLGGMLLATILGVLFYPAFFLLIGKMAHYEQKRKQEEDQN